MLGQVFITKACGEDKAGIVSIVSYSNLPFAIFIGILLGDQIPDTYAFTGMILIITSGIFIAIRRNF